MIRGTALAAFACVVALLVAGCGEDRGPGTKTHPRPLEETAGRELGVSLSEYRLDPAGPHLARAGALEFDVINDGDLAHALAVETPAGVVRTRTLRAGERATLRVRLPAGTYKWYCPLDGHEGRGMAGRISVG